MQSITGTGALNLRFPGQWFQLETGLHYNWHRSYDPTIGRYTQPDPLGFVDGPSVYGYVGGSPQRWVDPDGRNAIVVACLLNPLACGTVVIVAACIAYAMQPPANDNTEGPRNKKYSCSEGFQLCIKARGGLFKAGTICSELKRKCDAGATVIFGPGIIGSSR